jgi:hypothetical protein
MTFQKYSSLFRAQSHVCIRNRGTLLGNGTLVFVRPQAGNQNPRPSNFGSNPELQFMDEMLRTLPLPRTQAIAELTLRALFDAPRHHSRARRIQFEAEFPQSARYSRNAPLNTKIFAIEGEESYALALSFTSLPWIEIFL